MKEPTGFTCECGEHHKFSSYVFAHWRDRLNHVCPKCDRVHAVICGRAKLLKGQRTFRAEDSRR